MNIVAMRTAPKRRAAGAMLATFPVFTMSSSANQKLRNVRFDGWETISSAGSSRPHDGGLHMLHRLPSMCPYIFGIPVKKHNKVNQGFLNVRAECSFHKSHDEYHITKLFCSILRPIKWKWGAFPLSWMALLVRHAIPDDFHLCRHLKSNKGAANWQKRGKPKELEGGKRVDRVYLHSHNINGDHLQQPSTLIQGGQRNATEI